VLLSGHPYALAVALSLIDILAEAISGKIVYSPSLLVVSLPVLANFLSAISSTSSLNDQLLGPMSGVTHRSCLRIPVDRGRMHP
jgi:hypothetical protein